MIDRRRGLDGDQCAGLSFGNLWLAPIATGATCRRRAADCR
jgi:hypothetical protein